MALASVWPLDCDGRFLVLHMVALKAKRHPRADAEARCLVVEITLTSL